MEKSRFDYVVFDIETTGLDPKSDRICEIGAIGVRGGLPQETFSTLVSIGGKMPARATEINGITDEMLTSAPAIGEALDGFIEFIGDMPMLVGHIVRLEDVLHGGKHCIIHRGAEHVFKTNKDAYEFMANAVKESGRE